MQGYGREQKGKNENEYGYFLGFWKNIKFDFSWNFFSVLKAVKCQPKNCKNVSVIFKYRPCKDGNARFTTVPLKRYSDQKCERYTRFSDSKLFRWVSPLNLISEHFRRESANKINSYENHSYLIRQRC